MKCFINCAAVWAVFMGITLAVATILFTTVWVTGAIATALLGSGILSWAITSIVTLSILGAILVIVDRKNICK